MRASSNKPIEGPPPNTLTKLDQFIGYGNPYGPFWFLGLEEALRRKSRSAILDNLMVRIDRFEEVEDCRSALLKLKDTRWHNEMKPELQSTWRWMASIMVGLAGGDRTSERALAEYQRDQLGRRHGNTMLVELFPLPKPNYHAWPDVYRQWFGYPDAQAYRADMRKTRIARIKELLQTYSPRVVVCYGKANEWEDFKAVFDDVKFEEGDPSGRWRAGTHCESLVILALHFSWFSRSRRNLERGNKCCRGIMDFLCRRGLRGLAAPAAGRGAAHEAVSD